MQLRVFCASEIQFGFQLRKALRRRGRAFLRVPNLDVVNNCALHAIAFSALRAQLSLTLEFLRVAGPDLRVPISSTSNSSPAALTSVLRLDQHVDELRHRSAANIFPPHRRATSVAFGRQIEIFGYDQCEREDHGDDQGGDHSESSWASVRARRIQVARPSARQIGIRNRLLCATWEFAIARVPCS